MILRLSQFAHLLPVADGRVLVIHAASQMRLVVDRELAEMIAFFREPRDLGPEADVGSFTALIERQILTDKTPQEELAELTGELGAYYGRDPVEALDRLRRGAKEGGEAYWSAGAALSAADLQPGARRLDVLLFGDCDIQMEADFLRREAAGRGLDLRVAATFPDDHRLAAERKHDAIIIGALAARHAITDPLRPDDSAPPCAPYIAEARGIIEGLRAHTAAPILLDNLPEPTVQPLGMADRGGYSHRNRFRLANILLSDLAENYPDVHVVDVAATLGGIGAERLLDDGQVGYTHFGSPGWMLQRTPDEMAAVHGIFPDVAPLAQAVGGDPYGREAAMAKAHVDALQVVTGLDRKKCVIVDLDGVLWPGVLAETGAPFAWSPEVSGPFSYIGLFFGLHEALLSLKQRGILLACVSKNDEATVRELWKYEDHYPRERLLTPDDFVTWRVNWDNKVDNIRSIADELGFAAEAFLFIDDNPVERENVRQRLPEVEVWGDELFSLRRRLLNDPRLQAPRVSEESAQRTALTQAQLSRQRTRADAADEQAFVASLDVRTEIVRLEPGARLDRIEELFQRTTQFNATGAKFSQANLDALIRRADAEVFAIQVSDRFGDHGLVGAAVIEGDEITAFALSCRVLGLGVEHRFLQHVVQALSPDRAALTARIVETSRNTPVRNLYRDNGFEPVGENVWRRSLTA
ncbi:MAG TPA: HAD-IIIC family phosphatase [Phenylobacterium sp.]|jgi:FkbH-like protein|uniref:HAD-IIIC family phosphatase n=1 Tax=Phenylobacterium sp. TaxID=1871053 RepID=UPI002B5A9F5E|nr:HAD-IIIC family phosphatase [Phenylobacterium sp.]HXA37928.1 HAD-IIIC family phosphatase [Phenylobacterium sp.]